MPDIPVQAGDFIPDSAPVAPVAAGTFIPDEIAVGTFVSDAETPQTSAEPYSEYLKKLPESDIVRQFREDTKAGIATDRKLYEDAYALRAGEANWTGSKDLTGRTPDRSVLDVLKAAGSTMWEGFKTQAGEAGSLIANNWAKPGTPEYNRAQQAMGNIVQGMTKGTLEGMHMFDRTASKLYNQLTEWGVTDPKTAASRRRQQFARDVEIEAAYDDLKSGVPAALPGSGGSLPDSRTQFETDPAKVESIADSPLGDLEVFLPGAAAFSAGRAPVSSAARALEKTAAKQATLAARMAAKPAEYAARIAAATERSIGASPAMRAALAGGGATLLGGDPATAVLAAIVGAETKGDKILKGIRVGAEKVASNLADAGGPLSKFSAAAYRTAASPTAKAIVAGQLANAPFALGAGSEEEFKDALAVGAIASGLGIGGERVRSGLDIRANFFAPHDSPPETRMESKAFGVSEMLDREHSKVMSEINNSGFNFVEGIRSFLRKKGAGEIYAVSPEGYKAALEELTTLDPALLTSLQGKDISEAAATQGVTLSTKDKNGKPRTVALFVVRDGAPGLGAGHEAVHMLEKTLSKEQLTHIYGKIAAEYGEVGIDNARRKYAQDLGVDPAAMSDEFVLSELFAESGSALLNSVPISQFGPNKGKGWKSTVREIYGLVGEGMRKIGLDVPETAVKQERRGEDGLVYTRWVPPSSSGPKTALGFDPSISGARAVENILQAMALDADVFSSPVETVPTEVSPGDNRPNLPDVREAVPPPVFKKGEKLAGDIFGEDGKVVGKDATILEVFEDDQSGEHKYKILFSSKGKTWEATVPQKSLQSQVSTEAEVTTKSPEQATTPTPTPAPSPVLTNTPTSAPTPVPAPASTPVPPKNIHVTPAQQEAFAVKATPETIKANIAVAQAADSLPTHQKQAFETEYYSAKGEVGEDATVREQRRKLADAAEKTGKKNPLRAIYQKIFVPYRYVPGKTPRVFGFSYDKLIQNVDVLRGWAAANDPKMAARLSDSQFANTVRNYLENQSNGYGGEGTVIKMPADARPGSITPVNPNYTPKPVSAEDARLVNLLMGIELPQKSSPASQFAARMARQNGLTPTLDAAGVEVTNPLYLEAVSKGFNPRLLNSVVENLPIDRMTTVLKPRPDLQVPAGDLGITRAGFLPANAQDLNIGLNVTDGEPNTVEQVLSVLKAAGIEPERYEVKQSGTEPTLIARIPATDDAILAQISDTLKQDAIAVRNPDGTGKLLGPRAAAWGEFNPEFFLKPSAPVEFVGIQEGAYPGQEFELYNLTQDIEGHPEGSTVSRETLEKAGYDVPPRAQFLPAPPVESEAFKKWFGDSKVVGEDGKPMIVYHGTAADFSVFDVSKSGTNFGVKEPGFFFTNFIGDAEAYARNAAKKSGGANLVPAYVSLENPLVIRADSDGRGAIGLLEDRQGLREEVASALTGGEYDGVLVQATDVQHWETKNPETLVVATKSEQIKSATGNRGTYDPSNPDIRFLPAAKVQHSGKPLENSLGEKALNLIHFGGAGIEQVDPRNFGKSGLTPRSEMSGLPRSYFYEQGKVNKSDPVAVRGDVYGAKVSGAKIYDGDTDALGFGDMINREKADTMLQKSGYVGLARSVGKYRQIELFSPTNVQKISSPTARFLPTSTEKQEKAFKDSKVRGPDGKLLPLFHGTYSDFKKFKKGDLGYHFGTTAAANARIGKAIADLNPSELEAESAFDAFPELRENMPPGARGAIEGIADGARTLPVFLDIKNPLRMDDVGPWDDPEEVWNLIPNGLIRDAGMKAAAKEVDRFVRLRNRDLLGVGEGESAKAQIEALTAIREGLKSLGYDGVIYQNAFEAADNRNLTARDWKVNPPKENDSYIAFDNAQIMPAFSQDAKARFLPAAKPGAKEWVTEAALKVGKRTYTGSSHWSAWEKAQEEGTTFDDISDLTDAAFGFLSNKGRWLSRSAASSLAVAAGQLSPEEAQADYSGKLEAERFIEDGGGVQFLPDAKVAIPGKGLVDPRETRSYKNMAKHLTPAEADKIRRDTAQDMLDIYNELPADEDFETAATAGSIKKGWYKRAADSLQFIFGDDTERFVGLVAAMSPKQSVQENLRMSFKVWADWLDAGRPLETDKLTDIVERHARIPSRVPNSVRAMQGYLEGDKPNTAVDKDAKLSGFKVESFRRNLLGDLTPSTNDTWMAQFANIDKALFGTKSGYLAFNAKIRKVADKLDMKPAEVQETVWSFFKTLTEATTVATPAKEALRNLTESDILQTPEFHEQILTDPQVRAQLERLGFTGFDSLAGNSNPVLARPGSLADIVVQEGGERRRVVLDRIARRAQSIKDVELAGEAEIAPATDDSVPF